VGDWRGKRAGPWGEGRGRKKEKVKGTAGLR